MTYQELLEIEPYQTDQAQKEEWFCGMFDELCDWHSRNCEAYQKMLRVQAVPEHFTRPEQIPMVPVQLFKERELRSIPQEEVFKEVRSSGTTGSAASRIFLNEEVATCQQMTLYRILQDYLGKKRVPMLIIDSPDVLKNRAMFSARGAGILGFSVCSSKRVYALDENMQVRWDVIEQFEKDYGEQPVLLFGFTFMIWKYFYRQLEKEGKQLHLTRGVLFHGGGWKKMQDEAVSKEIFNKSLKERTGVRNVYDYYGMAEQTGCIYVECEYGHLHASLYSDVIIRASDDFHPCGIGEEGMIQVLSPMAKSYPGHSILTQDMGILRGVDDCPCKRKGKYFDITGRIKNSMVRGCSDTYEG